MSKNFYQIIIVILLAVIILGPSIYSHNSKPKNSFELYEELKFTVDINEAKSMVLDKYNSNFNTREYRTIKQNPAPNRINQITLLQFNGKTILIETTPDTNKMKIIRVVELPEDIQNYFSEFAY